MSAPVDVLARLATLERFEAERRRNAPTHWGAVDEARAREADALRAALAACGVKS